MDTASCVECNGTGRCGAHGEPECMMCAGDGECPYCYGTGQRRQVKAPAVFEVLTSPWEYGLTVEIVGVGVTQTHRGYPGTVEAMARDYIRIMRDLSDDEFTLAYRQGSQP